ncbi:MAG: DUF2384 domain-containing protein [Proteiniphilum sp.]|jgi:putative toxin-antitoxin system antitoxin component (TIGR02293 family)|nr:DUF2384 domain-containing protein [Proteiniphilum sp.]
MNTVKPGKKKTVSKKNIIDIRSERYNNNAPVQILPEPFLKDRMKIVKEIRKGISYTFFNEIQGKSPFTESEWAELLNISTKSLQRYKGSDNYRFKPLQSERIIAMTEVMTAGLDLFGNADRLKEWLNTPNFALGNLKPMDLLTDSYGKELVMEELTRLNYGIFV